MSEALLTQLLGPLHMRLQAARALYRAYLDGGRRFKFADALREANLESRRLLLDEGWRLPEALQADAAALVAHWEVWLALWRDLQTREQPGPDDTFVFENDFTYPREAEARIEALYAELKGPD